jgi:hypothetical protein
VLHKVDPDRLTDEQWAQRLADSQFVIRLMADMLFGSLKKAI